MATYFSKQLKGGVKSSFARSVMKDAEIAKAFDRFDEKKLMVDAVSKFAEPGKKITNQTLRKASGYMATKGIIDRREQRAFEKLITAGPKHLTYKEEKKVVSSGVNPAPIKKQSAPSERFARPASGLSNNILRSNIANVSRPVPRLNLSSVRGFGSAGTFARGSSVAKK
jgi:hypothetical protein